MFRYFPIHISILAPHIYEKMLLSFQWVTHNFALFCITQRIFFACVGVTCLARINWKVTQKVVGWSELAQLGIWHDSQLRLTLHLVLCIWQMMKNMLFYCVSACCAFHSNACTVGVGLVQTPETEISPHLLRLIYWIAFSYSELPSHLYLLCTLEWLQKVWVALSLFCNQGSHTLKIRHYILH